MSEEVRAVIDNGTSKIFSSRLRAVTVISSSAAPSCAKTGWDGADSKIMRASLVVSKPASCLVLIISAFPLNISIRLGYLFNIEPTRLNDALSQ